MKIRLLVSIIALALVVPATVTITGCKSTTTLDAGGAYTFPSLAIADQSILDASKAMTGFVAWANANAAYLAKWPEVGALAAKVAAQKDGWLKDAYAARDAYASAYKDFQAGKAGATAAGADAKLAALNGAIAAIQNVIAQINSYKSAHNV